MHTTFVTMQNFNSKIDKPINNLKFDVTSFTLGSNHGIMAFQMGILSHVCVTMDRILDWRLVVATNNYNFHI
jgi:hypothetical protein